MKSLLKAAITPPLFLVTLLLFSITPISAQSIISSNQPSTSKADPATRRSDSPGLSKVLNNYAVKLPEVLSNDSNDGKSEGENKAGENNTGANTANPTGGVFPQIGGNFADRAFSRDRNAPRRQNLNAIKIVKHINGLLGGYEQGAGFGFGLEFTTADSIPGIELYARAMGSLRLYRQGELGAIIGNEKTRGEIWFNYLRRTRDNFFGIGPRTSDFFETNYSVESRSYNAVFSHKFMDNLDAGIYARISNTDSFRGEDDNETPIDTFFSGNPLNIPVVNINGVQLGSDLTRYLPGLNTNAKLFSYGVFAEVDLRNNESGLTRGGYFYGRFSSIDGLQNGNQFSDFGWTEFEIDGRAYVPIFSNKTSIALRAYADLKDPKRGSQIPFYELSWLGGRSYLRGFQNYRFRGNNSLLFAGEFRQTVYPQSETKGVDVFVFTDSGQVWGDNRSKTNTAILANDNFNDSNWRIGAGGGVQYRMSKSTAFRIEIGASNERTMVYFSLSRGF
jgi:hypothetical protein